MHISRKRRRQNNLPSTKRSKVQLWGSKIHPCFAPNSTTRVPYHQTEDSTPTKCHNLPTSMKSAKASPTYPKAWTYSQPWKRSRTNRQPSQVVKMEKKANQPPKIQQWLSTRRQVKMKSVQRHLRTTISYSGKEHWEKKCGRSQWSNSLTHSRSIKCHLWLYWAAHTSHRQRLSSWFSIGSCYCAVRASKCSKSMSLSTSGDSSRSWRRQERQVVSYTSRYGPVCAPSSSFLATVEKTSGGTNWREFHWTRQPWSHSCWSM